jgi:hypothetical protein
MVAWPHMDVFSFATGGNNGVVARILLLHGGSNNLFSDQLVRFVLVLSICDMPFSGSSAPVVAKAEFCTGLPSSTWLMLVVPAFASLAVAEVVPLISLDNSLAFAALSKVWSYVSAMACGFRSGWTSSHCAVSTRRCVGHQQWLMKRSIGGPLHACLHISIFFRGLLVIWVCNVLLSAI